MADERNQKTNRENSNNQNVEQTRNRNSDLKDSPRDEERLRGEEGTIDMPEVKDIPGQEHVRVPSMGDMADTTASSADEEGEGVLDDLNAEDLDDDIIRMGTEADVSPTDVAMLRTGDSYYPSRDEDQLVDASMDNVDFDGEPLNVKGFGLASRTGADLDVPGAEEDDIMEESGAEDEANNEYSLGDQENERELDQ